MMRMRFLNNTIPLLLLCVAIAGCSSPEEKEAKYIKKGNALFDAGEYEKARLEYKNAAKLKPTDAEVYYRLGLVEEAENNFREAFNAYTRAEQQNPHFHLALLKVAAYYLAAEQLGETNKRLATVLTDSPDDAGGRALHAAILLREKSYPEAEAEARFALSQDPANIVAYSVLIGLYSSQKDAAKVETTLEEGIAHNPKDLSLLILKAQIYERSGNMAKIAEAYNSIFKLRPNEERYHLNLASIYLKMNKIDEAEAALRQGMAALPDDWDIKHQLVILLDEKRNAEIAEKEINSIHAAYPKNDEPYGWLVDLYMHHDREADAEALLHKMIADNGSNDTGMKANVLLARLQYLKGNSAEASKLLASALEKMPNDTDALFLRAHIAADHADYQNAIIDLRAVTRDKPRSREALQLLSDVLLAQGHPDLAIETLNQFIDLDPTNIAARVRLAQLYDINGNTKKAEGMLFLVTKENPTYPVGWETTARIALKEKDWSTAESAINTLDKLEGQHLTASLLRGELLASQNKTSEAITEYRTVIDGASGSPLLDYALTALVAAYEKLNQDEAAAQYLLSLKTPTTLSESLLGKSYLRLKKYDVAAAAYDRAIMANATQLDVYLGRAQLYLIAKDTEKALAILKQGSTVAPSDIRPDMLRAGILTHQERFKEAREVYEDLLKRNPNQDVVANNYAELVADYEYDNTAVLERAKQTAERFIASSDPSFLDTLAWVYLRVGNINQAQIMMERAIATGEKLPAQSHYHFGVILLKADKPERAKAELTQAIATQTPYPGLDDAKAQLAKLK